MAQGGGFAFDIKAVPGDEWILNFPDLHNLSHQSIVIENIEMQGTGIGSVVAVKRIWIAPRDRIDVPDWTPGGVFKTLPPSFRQLGTCYHQRLVPATGYVVHPGDEPRVAIWMRAVAPGGFNAAGPMITYSVGGQTYQQFEPEGMDGSVAEAGRPLQPNSRAERTCMNNTNRLPSGQGS